MKLLIVARHGGYTNDHLDQDGIRQIGILTDKLRPVIGRSSVRILTSTAARAQESANILARAFGVQAEAHDVLWSDEHHPQNNSAALLLVQSRGGDVDILMLVTHFEYAKDFPGYFSTTHLGVRLPSVSIKTGQAWVLDCEKKTIIRIG